MARTGRDALTAAPDRGQLPASSGGKPVLRPAASLDNANPNLTVTAIRHAAGHR